MSHRTGMLRSRVATLASGVLAGSLLAGCTLAPAYHRPNLPVPRTYPAADVDSGQSGIPASDIGWREFFGDERLQTLIAMALANNPQMALQDKADNYATLRILGATLTSEVGASGSRALGDVHADTKEESFLGLAKWVAASPLKQLAMAFCRLNYDDTSECPTLEVDTSVPEKPLEKATRLTVASKIVPLPKQWAYTELGVPMPQDGEPTVGGMPTVAGGAAPLPPGGEPPAPEDLEASGLAGKDSSLPGRMLVQAGGNGDKHNRIYRFESVPILSGTAAHRVPPTAQPVTSLAPVAGKELAVVPSVSVPTNLQRATATAYVKQRAAANLPLQKRLQAVAALTDDDAFTKEMAALVKDFPELAKAALRSPHLKQAASTLGEGMAASMVNGLTGKPAAKPVAAGEPIECVTGTAFDPAKHPKGPDGKFIFAEEQPT